MSTCLSRSTQTLGYGTAEQEVNCPAAYKLHVKSRSSNLNTLSLPVSDGEDFAAVGLDVGVGVGGGGYTVSELDPVGVVEVDVDPV